MTNRVASDLVRDPELARLVEASPSINNRLKVRCPTGKLDPSGVSHVRRHSTRILLAGIASSSRFGERRCVLKRVLTSGFHPGIGRVAGGEGLRWRYEEPRSQLGTLGAARRYKAGVTGSSPVAPMTKTALANARLEIERSAAWCRTRSSGRTGIGFSLSPVR